MKITGYGKGWQEPKASTVVGRFFQKMREPATTTDYIVMLTFGFIVLSAIGLLKCG